MNSTEKQLYEYELSAGSIQGTINYFWSTACGGRGIDWSTESGITIYRIYIDGETTASLEFTPRMAVGLGFPPNGAQPVTGPSLQEPWGTDLLGKASDLDGYFLKFKIPFYKKFVLTAQLPAGVAGFNVYTIIRGFESNSKGQPGLSIPGYGPLPLGTRLHLYRNEAIVVPSLAFIPIVNITVGEGLIFAHAVSVQGHPTLFFLEVLSYHSIYPNIAILCISMYLNS